MNSSSAIVQYVINFRYWKPDGSMVQLQVESNDSNSVSNRITKVIKECQTRGWDYLAEVFPRLSDPIVYGSRRGLAHRRELL